MRLGKRPARHAVRFKFAEFFDTTKLPVPPKVFGNYPRVPKWFGLGNDRYGNCVWAGAAHETMLWTLEGFDVRARFTIKDTLSDYSEVTGFDPNKPLTDQGTDMQEAASYRRKVGIIDARGNRHKIDSYVALDIGDVDELALAVYLCGACGVGLELPQSAMEGLGRPWDVVESSRILGGHYVPVMGRNEAGNFVLVTWGDLQEMTPNFYHRYSDEALAYLSIERLKEEASPEGFDLAKLQYYLARL